MTQRLARRLWLSGILAACLLVNARPVFSQQTTAPPSGINDSFKKPDVGAFVERFEREGREVYDKRAKIIETLDLPTGAAVADIGAGTGLFTRLLAKQVGPTGRVYAVDIAQEFLDHIEKTSRAEGITQVVGVLGTQETTGLEPGSIDVAFTCDTYHHFEHPDKTLANLMQALRPGGHLYVVDFERIEGKSSDWILGHVRAGKDVVTKEIKAAGFQTADVPDFLDDNYLLHFRKPAE